MSSFTEARFVKLNRKRQGRELYAVQGLVFEIGYKGSGMCITVPDEFETDGPSIPKWMWKLVPSHKLVKSSAVHDLLRQDLRLDKITGDAIFLTAMIAERTPKWLRWLAFAAVLLNSSRERAI